MKSLFILLFSITLFLNDCFSQDEVKNCYQNIPCDDFNLIIETKDVILIDVRLNKEFRKERLFGAYIADNRESLIDLLKNREKTLYVLIYCDESGRSQTASQIVCKELQFKNVYNLEGGIKSWKKRGYPIDNTRIKSKLYQ